MRNGKTYASPFQIVKRHPEYEMEKRMLLGTIDKEKGTVVVEGVEYPLNDKNFPTLDPANPYGFSP